MMDIPHTEKYFRWKKWVRGLSNQNIMIAHQCCGVYTKKTWETFEKKAVFFFK